MPKLIKTKHNFCQLSIVKTQFTTKYMQINNPNKMNGYLQLNQLITFFLMICTKLRRPSCKMS